MRYALKLILHGCIFLGRVGLIFGACALSLVYRSSETEEKSHIPDQSDFSHPYWGMYWGDENKR